MLSRAEALGGRITQPAQEAFWGGYYGHFSDPGASFGKLHGTLAFLSRTMVA